MPSRHLALPCRRAASLCLCAVLALALTCALPPAAMSAAVEEGNALNELTKPQQETTPAQTTPSTAATESSSSNSSTVVVLALAAAVALLIAIAFVIVHDARKVAPVADAEFKEGGSAHDSAARLRRRRARAKAARRQRKRNR